MTETLTGVRYQFKEDGVIGVEKYDLIESEWVELGEQEYDGVCELQSMVDRFNSILE